MNAILLYLGAILTIVWGIAHLVPTKNVVKGFGDITADNKRILTMEWIIEGATLIFLGLLTALMTYADFSAWLAKVVFLLVVLFLILLSIICETGMGTRLCRCVFLR
jgi:hypothetical protein